jgi:hypothetical protein
MYYNHAQLMTALSRISQRRFRFSTGILASVMYLLASACSLIHSGTLLQTKVVDEVLVDGPRGAVFLQKAEDGWFRTAHPIALSPSVLETVLRGVRVLALPTNTAVDTRVFSDEDIEFLSPVMSSAFSKATKSQVVGFRVVHDTDAGQETTGGILYLQGRLLHVTFTHYRARHDHSEQSGASRRLHPNPTGMDKSQITFSPETARRSSRHEQPDVTVAPPLASLVLDYETLTAGSAPSPLSVESRPLRSEKVPVLREILETILPTSGTAVSQDTHAGPDDTSRAVQEPARESERELEGVKEEMRRLQRRLDDLERAKARSTTP